MHNRYFVVLLCSFAVFGCGRVGDPSKVNPEYPRTYPPSSDNSNDDAYYKTAQNPVVYAKEDYWILPQNDDQYKMTTQETLNVSKSKYE